ncbi:MAG TPA: hypothetical protein VHL34_25155 [Rhizomicrobium sp.]|jgi:hypothetical protein|nr:hypothetical protein [Rhizomicrobium sp.]
MVPIDNGYRFPLVIPNVFSGQAGVSGNQLAFIPNLRGGRAELAKSGTLDGFQIPLVVQKLGAGPFYGATFDPFLLAEMRAAATTGDRP